MAENRLIGLFLKEFDMKIVKRIGVFETNSSSTHSFSIVNNEGIDNSYTVQIVSAEEKLIWLQCMINNAEEHYKSRLNWCLDLPVKTKAEDLYKNLFILTKVGYSCEFDTSSFSYDKAEFEAFKKELETYYCDSQGVEEEDMYTIPQYKFYDLKDPIVDYVSKKFAIDRKLVVKFVNKNATKIENITSLKDFVLDYCCKKLDNTVENLEEQLGELCSSYGFCSEIEDCFCEDFDVEPWTLSSTVRDECSRDEVLLFQEKLIEYYCKKNNVTKEQLDSLLNQKVKKIPENSGKCRHYTRDGKPRASEGYNRFYCLRYFDEGAMDDCECGFETYEAISGEFPYPNDSQKFLDYIEWFLSDKCKIVAKEKYGYGF